MDNLQASPRNSLGYLADILHSVKGFGDKASVPNFVPLIGGTGLGELLMGKSPELMDDMSYNPSSAIRGGNRATGGLGTYTLDKRSADLGMTLADVLGLGVGTTKLAGKGATSLIDSVGTNLSRREFMKKAGALGAGAAATVATPAVLRSFVKEAEHVAPKAAAHVVDNAAVSTVKHKYNSLAEYLDEINTRSSHVFDGPNRAYRAQDEIARDLLHSDEVMYNVAKDHKRHVELEFADDPQAMGYSQKLLDRLEEFSPKAKAEMKAFKQSHMDNWGEPDVGGYGSQLPDYAPRWHEAITGMDAPPDFPF